MITRVFRVRIDPGSRSEFEEKFADISVNFVKSSPGLVSVVIGKPTKWAPDEYVMISVWEDESALVDFAGDEWSQAHIPAGMGRFIQECWVHHYAAFDPT
jgi:heme-degrading monooxygenase HmoA